MSPNHPANYAIATLLLVFAVTRPPALGAELKEDSIDASIKAQTQPQWLLILNAEPDFHAAKREAERASHLSGVRFSMDGKVFDKGRGLILPDNAEDGVYAGEYVLRRYHLDGHLSIEKSDAYRNLKKGYYIVLGGIYDSSRDAQNDLRRFQKIAPSAYIARTEIYMGCMH